MTNSVDTATLLERVARLILNEGNADGLNPVQWESLRFFGRANKFSCSPSALTDYLGVTKGTASQTINAIERKGLIKKHRVAGDARAVNIQLTPRGKILLQKNPLLSLKDDLDELTTQELKDLDTSLRRVIETSIRRRGSAAFGVCYSCIHFQSTHEDGNPHRCGLLALPLTKNDSTLICREHAA